MKNKEITKTAYYQVYDPSVLDMTEYCIREEMCDNIGDLEDDIFKFGKKIVKFSKNLDGLDAKEIASKLQSIVAKYCKNYLNPDDNIANLDEYDGLEIYEDEYEYEDEDEDEDEYEDEDEDEW